MLQSYTKYYKYFYAIILSSVWAIIVLPINNGIYKAYENTWYLYFIITASVIIIFVSTNIIISEGKIYRININVLDSFVLIFLFYSFIRLLFTPDNTLDDKQFIIQLFLTVLYFIWKEFSKINNLDGISIPLMILISAFLLSGLVESVIGIFQFYDILPGYVNSYFKVNGTFINPDNYSGYLSTILPFSFGIYKFIHADSWKLRILKYMGLVVFLATIYILPLLLERASLIACATGILFIYLCDKKIQNKIKSNINTGYKKGVTVFFLLAILLVGVKIVYSMRSNSVDGRLLIWKITGNMIKDTPVVGNGFNRFEVDYKKYQANYFASDNWIKDEKYLAGNVNHANNEYLQIASDLGIIGFILWMGIVITILIGNSKYIITSMEKNDNEFIYISAKASLVSILIVALFSSPLRVLPTNINFFFLLSLFSALNKSVEGNSIFFKNIKFRINWFTGLPILIATAGFSAFILFNTIHSFDVYKIWQNGYDLAAHGFYQKSINEYNKIDNNLNNNGEYLFSYGSTLMLDGNIIKAISLIEKSKSNFTDPKQYINLGICYEKLGSNKDAEENYRYVSNMIPNLLYPKYLLAKLLVKDNKVESAKLLCTEILNSNEKIESKATVQMKGELKTLLVSLNNPIQNGEN